MVRDCEKLKKKKEKDTQQGKPTQKKTYRECGSCGKKNHPEERCWQGAGAHPKPKLSIQMTTIQILRYKNLSTNQHRPIPNLHPTMMIQKTNFATTPI